jgi:hypothetical protein
MRVTFSPERLGHGTSLGLSLRIAAPAGRASSPLTQLTLGYSSELGFSTSRLGLASCLPERLEALGPSACPEESRMGQGSALTTIPFESRTIQERTQVAILRAPEQSGHPALLLYLTGTTPVIAQIVLRGVLLPGLQPSEERLRIDVPLVPVVPGGPDATVTKLDMTIGPTGLIYRERRHGKLIAYHPGGILLPNTCPKGGFAFHVAFAFLDGAQAHAGDTVPCPGQRVPAREG